MNCDVLGLTGCLNHGFNHQYELCDSDDLQTGKTNACSDVAGTKISVCGCCPVFDVEGDPRQEKINFPSPSPFSDSRPHTF